MSDLHLNKKELRSEVSGVLARESSIRSVQSALDANYDMKASLWPLFARLGWLGLAVPKSDGGLGQTFAHLSILYYELGKTLAAVPFLSTMAITEAVLRFGDATQKQKILPKLVEGMLHASLPSPESDAAISAKIVGNLIQLNGSARFYFGDPDAQLVLIHVLFENGDTGYVLVDPSMAGFRVAQVPSWDRTRAILEVDCRNVELPDTDLLCRGAAAIRLKSRLVGHISLGLACDSVGGASAILAMTLEYMAIRQQFGRAIASFQALKHRCAEHKARLDGASALTEAACDAFAQDDATAPMQASAAKRYACAIYKEIAEDAIQLHGGIGFTWEHPCHLFLKRARLNEMLGGTANWHRDAIAAEMYRAVKAETGTQI